MKWSRGIETLKRFSTKIVVISNLVNSFNGGFSNEEKGGFKGIGKVIWEDLERRNEALKKVYNKIKKKKSKKKCMIIKDCKKKKN